MQRYRGREGKEEMKLKYNPQNKPTQRKNQNPNGNIKTYKGYEK